MEAQSLPKIVQDGSGRAPETIYVAVEETFQHRKLLRSFFCKIVGRFQEIRGRQKQSFRSSVV